MICSTSTVTISQNDVQKWCKLLNPSPRKYSQWLISSIVADVVCPSVSWMAVLVGLISVKKMIILLLEIAWMLASNRRRVKISMKGLNWTSRKWNRNNIDDIFCTNLLPHYHCRAAQALSTLLNSSQDKPYELADRFGIISFTSPFQPTFSAISCNI